MTTAAPADLLAATAQLVALASVSRAEGALADAVAAGLAGRAGLEVVRIGDNLVARTDLGRAHRLLLAGHLDTVPPSGNAEARIDGDVLHGVGSADMKGGLAVMAALVDRFFPVAPATATGSPAVDLTFVWYAREEVARSESGLLEVAAARPELLVADAAVLLEPTSAAVEAGCQGVVKARVRLGGRRAHVARPWAGVNAVHRLAPVLARIAEHVERRPVIDGCTYRESLQAVAVDGGHAGNVVPDEATVVLVHRFAPDRDVTAAFAAIGDYLRPVLDPDAGDGVTLLDAAPAAAPGLAHPLLEALVRATGRPPEAKLGWTDAAFFAERGVPAANFGPGDALLAHGPDERVTRSDLEAVYAALVALVAAGSPP